jgi:predicted DCC family thiol-disulfide oxidoreductase YuxK
MRTLFVLYDPRCGICTQIRNWLVRQPAYVVLHPIAIASPEAIARFPQITPGNQELVVIADTGEVWIGDRAWIICLWALPEFRGWANKLSSPSLLPLARQAFLAFSSNRLTLSRLLGLRSEAGLRQSLEEIQVPACQI